MHKVKKEYWQNFLEKKGEILTSLKSDLKIKINVK